MSLLSHPLTLEKVRHQANIQSKAATLSERGYTGKWLNSEVVEVIGPEGQSYCLDLMTRTCNCPGFEENGLCSHLLGYDTLVRAQEKPDA
jgi:hypothetical protein